MSLIDDAHHGLGRNGCTGNGVDLICLGFGALLHGLDFGVHGQRIEIGDKCQVFVDLVAETGRLAAFQYLHAGHLAFIRQIAVEQPDDVLKAGSGTGNRIADQAALGIVAGEDRLIRFIFDLAREQLAVREHQPLHALDAWKHFKHRRAQYACLIGFDGG
jgi:hypothetical protein